MISVARSLLICVALATFCNAAFGVEPWSDSRLPVRDGLELWLDASVINEARKSSATSELSNEAPLDAWPDASGKHHDVRAPSEPSRPVLARIANTPVVRFDGENDHLRAVGQNTPLSDTTVFLVVIPRRNLGGFLGFVAFNAPGQRDYSSGLTIDQGASASRDFSSLNVEGRGFGGMQDLMNASHPFGTAHIVEVRAAADSRQVSLSIDGGENLSRPREASPISMEEITIGARFYNSGPGDQIAQGWNKCDIAEVLVYDRTLKPEESKQVHDYLEAKYAELKAAAQPEEGTPLVTVPNPPVIQMLVPGFETKQLSLDLPNLNNIRCRPDGKILALAYNGDMYLLSDTDGDGLEDHADKFWENNGSLKSPIGMTLTPPNYSHGQGAFIAAKRKCSLIVDTDGDDVADKEIIVAEGWTEIVHNVDALGTAFDPRDGSVYFGIATTDFTNAYVLDKQGTARYSPTAERGAIVRVSPDFKSREIVCSGIRFSVALGFNAEGDLFATDQEGATWLSNGNPYDELLHIEKGRHYGFPPRHPKHLPNVIDEPSVYDYGPQHQSTCGLFFNEPVVEGDPTFGPAAWRGDALVAGYSRGKIYRTSLAKTDSGYVAGNQLLACLNELTVDVCADRQGSLLVATHSGGPDWGSGPGGNGKLYKIRYTAPEAPQMVAAWSSAPDEVQIAFDRPLDPERLRAISGHASIQYGTYVKAGDRFEAVQPGYAAVGSQLIAPRRDQPVESVQLASDGRTLILVTGPAAARTAHAVTLPSEAFYDVKPAEGTIEQHPQVDFDYDMSGLRAVWTSADGSSSWEGWLPHPDLQVAKQFTSGSATHEALWPLLASQGTLSFETLIDLRDMLRPEVQPGSKIDYKWPDEVVTVTLQGSGALKLESPEGTVASDPNDESILRLVVPTQGLKPFPIRLTMATGTEPTKLTANWSTQEDARPHAFPLRRFFVPWSEDSLAPTDLVKTLPPELEGGSWSRGRKVFFGQTAGCFKCHAIHSKGGVAAPNLSNLVHRDYASVFRDVSNPNFAINPDYTTYVVADTSGRVFTGTVRGDGDMLRITDTKGEETVLSRDEVEQMAPGKTSTMPSDLTKLIPPDQMKDLLTFLLLPPPQMPLDNPAPPPEPRKRAEVEAVLAGAPENPPPPGSIRITLVAGEKDHGPGEHDYPAWQKAWTELLRTMENTEVATAWEWPEAEDFEKSDVLVFYQHGDWSDEKAKQIDAFLARGGGLVYIHFAVDGRAGATDFAKRIGLAWGAGAKFRHGPLDLVFNRGSDHPVVRNFDQLHLEDESYWSLTGDLPAKNVLATGVEEGQPQPLFWSTESGRGRVFVSIPGHFSWTFDDPLFRVLLLRGIAWTADEPVDRFNEGVWLGSRVTE